MTDSTGNPVSVGQELSSSKGASKMTQVFLTALFAIALSILTFAASFAEAPRSELISFPAESVSH
jgi:hypothetical protein